jgi:hypothetical protein
MHSLTGMEWKGNGMEIGCVENSGRLNASTLLSHPVRFAALGLCCPKLAKREHEGNDIFASTKESNLGTVCCPLALKCQMTVLHVVIHSN